MSARTRAAILSLVPSPNSPLHMPESIETEDSFRPRGLRIPTIQIPISFALKVNGSPHTQHVRPNFSN